MEKKSGKQHAHLYDFICAMMITNTNSVTQSGKNLLNYIKKIEALYKENHPYGYIVSKILKINGERKLCRGSIDYALS